MEVKSNCISEPTSWRYIPIQLRMYRKNIHFSKYLALKIYHPKYIHIFTRQIELYNCIY